MLLRYYSFDFYKHDFSTLFPLCSQRENQELQATLKLAQSELEVALSTHDSQKQIILTLNQQLATRVQELATIHDEISTAWQT